jgi:DNA-binding NarL/FixJ family response regulator
MAIILSFLFYALWGEPMQASIPSPASGSKKTNANDNLDSPTSLNQLCKALGQEYGLTQRQTEVIALLIKGRNAQHIGEQLGISMHTAKAHISAIYSKLAVHSQQEIIDIFEEHRYLK